MIGIKKEIIHLSFIQCCVGVGAALACIDYNCKKVFRIQFKEGVFITQQLYKFVSLSREMDIVLLKIRCQCSY